MIGIMYSEREGCKPYDKRDICTDSIISIQWISISTVVMASIALFLWIGWAFIIYQHFILEKGIVFLLVFFDVCILGLLAATVGVVTTNVSIASMTATSTIVLVLFVIGSFIGILREQDVAGEREHLVV